MLHLHGHRPLPPADSKASRSRAFWRSALLIILVALMATTLTRGIAPARAAATAVSVTSSIVTGQQLSGTISWTASVNGGTASSVEFWIDGSNRWTEFYAPYQFNADPDGRLATTTLSNGGHVLTVIARTSGGGSTSATANVTIANGTAPAATPTPTPTPAAVSVTSSVVTGQQLSGTISWTASVNGGTASSVEFWIDGSNRWTEFYAPYQFNADPDGRLATTTLSNGGHVLTVIARTSGGGSTSATANVTIANGTAPAATPTPTPAATPTAKPSPTPTPTATPAPPAPAGCSTSLQSLINAAPSGGTLNVPACTYRESVTVAKPLTINGSGSVIDGRDTSGTVVRQSWMTVNASNVVVDGFTMRYAANPAATGALRVADGMSNVTIRNCDLSWAASVAVGYGSANDSTVANCSIHDNGQMGVLLGRDMNGTTHGYRNALIGNRIYHNRKPSVETGVDGAVKATLQHNLQIRDNEVYENQGHAIWLDVDNVDTTISGNRVHHNEGPGIMMETSSGATISGNAVWNNGFSAAVWGWGAGILVASSKGANVYGNTVAWNYAGISVIGQQRPDSPGTTDNYVHDNIVVADQQAAGKDRFGMFWGQDYNGPLYAPASNNRGATNRFYYPGPENQYARFIWNGYKYMATFVTVPGGAGSSYMTTADATAALNAKGIPTTP